MNAISLVLRTREEFGKAAEYLQAILKLDANNGEAWGSLGVYSLLIPQLHSQTGLETERQTCRPLLPYA